MGTIAGDIDVKARKLFLAYRSSEYGTQENPWVYTQKPTTYREDLFQSLGSVYYKIAEYALRTKFKDGDIWEITISGRKIGALDKTRFPEERGSKPFRNLQEVKAAYDRDTANIESPWPFPSCWIGDDITFEINHGREMALWAERRQGKVVSIFPNGGSYYYKVKTAKEYRLVEYFNIRSHGGGGIR